MQPDSHDEKLMQLMLSLRQGGVTDRNVLEAMEKTPREIFVERAFRDRAFEDRPLPIACGQTISQPAIVAMMIQALQVTPLGWAMLPSAPATEHGAGPSRHPSTASWSRPPRTTPPPCCWNNCAPVA
jgi:hypothetical protein